MKLNLIVFFLFIFSFAAASPVAEPDEVDGLEGVSSAPLTIHLYKIL